MVKTPSVPSANKRPRKPRASLADALKTALAETERLREQVRLLEAELRAERAERRLEAVLYSPQPRKRGPGCA